MLIAMIPACCLRPHLRPQALVLVLCWYHYQNHNSIGSVWRRLLWVTQVGLQWLQAVEAGLLSYPSQCLPPLLPLLSCQQQLRC